MIVASMGEFSWQKSFIPTSMGEIQWINRTTRYNAPVRHSCSFSGDNMETAHRASATVSKKELAKANQPVDFPRKSGAGEGIRTLDPNLGKVVLYP